MASARGPEVLVEEDGAAEDEEDLPTRAASGESGGSRGAAAFRSLRTCEASQLTTGQSSTISSSHLRTASRLRVQCVKATNLPAADIRFLRPPTSDPYVILMLKDSANNRLYGQSQTRIMYETLNPRWNEEFLFTVGKKMEKLCLHVDVFDADDGEEDDFLGQAEVNLTRSLLRRAKGKWHEEVLKLVDDTHRQSPVPASGSLVLRIKWEPGGGSSELTLRRVLRSPRALNMWGATLLGTAALLLMVAAEARWLCSGAALSDCTSLEVPGGTTSAVLAAFGACTAALVQFAGAAGIFGRSWDSRPHSFADLLERELVAPAAVVQSGGRRQRMPNVQMEVQGNPMAGLSMSMTTAFIPRVSITTVRFISWLGSMVAGGMSSIGLLLTWVRHGGPSTIYGEAVYLLVFAAVNVAMSSCILYYRYTILARVEKLAETTALARKATVVGQEDNTAEKLQQTLANGFKGIEELRDVTRRRMSSMAQDFHSLAQPLLQQPQAQGRHPTGVPLATAQALAAASANSIHIDPNGDNEEWDFRVDEAASPQMRRSYLCC
eukprot:TRINITY_DN18614_c0_g2_i1.p1 TRINITY_DN18614_c0_g2~~TRINITY_DN18614_c0_g2_i1.p1  ORF type:complete len:575 (+),score=130.88 TRINITY_DN18614_c0_g2_i1:76-1725(+)